jgi:UPF0716 protein FxsA
MRGLPLYLIPLVALTELWLIIQVGSWLGAWVTIALVLGTGFVGVTLLRMQGFKLLAQLQARMQRGEIPAMELVEGVALLIGGLLLLTPGFLTDTLGLLLLLPPTRQALVHHYRDRLVAHMTVATTATTFRADESGSAGFRTGESATNDSTFEPPYASTHQSSRPQFSEPGSGQIIDGEFSREDDKQEKN